MILSALCEGRADVRTLVGGATSPHTYEPLPSDARGAADALSMFFVADDLDGWAAQLPATRRYALIEALPTALLLPGELESALHEYQDDAAHEHHHGTHDPHVWSDPTMVAAMLPRLVEELSACDPGGAEIYASNAAAFAARLKALDLALAEALAPVRGRPVILMHLSMQYFLHRYGLQVAAVLEPSPGKEASPRYLQQVITTVRSSGAKLVFSEPQLPRRPAEVVAQAAGVGLGELDPYGGLAGRETYEALLRYNAAALRSALE